MVVRWTWYWWWCCGGSASFVRGVVKVANGVAVVLMLVDSGGSCGMMVVAIAPCRW